MKTAIEQVEDVFGLLNVPSVTGLLGDGQLIRFKRPTRSKECDIVVNSLSLSNRPLQKGTINVNIHVPSSEHARYNGIADAEQPNIPKMIALQNVVIPILEANYTGLDFHIDLENCSEPMQDADKTWYLNLRVNYYSFSNNYQNI